MLYHLVCYITWVDASLDDLQNEAFTWNPIVSLKQKLSGLNITNWYVIEHWFLFCHIHRLEGNSHWGVLKTKSLENTPEVVLFFVKEQVATLLAIPPQRLLSLSYFAVVFSTFSETFQLPSKSNQIFARVLLRIIKWTFSSIVMKNGLTYFKHVWALQDGKSIWGH